jgi:hypothetical protein
MTEAPLPPTTFPPRRGLRRPAVLIGKVAVVLGIIVTTVLLLAFRSDGRELTVNFALLDYRSSCAGGSGGYNDVGPGMPVVIRNNDGQVIATGQLGGGGEPVDVGIGPKVGCEWTAVVEDVPRGEDYYAIEVGSRGEQIYTGDQLEERGWSIDLSLGSP